MEDLRRRLAESESVTDKWTRALEKQRDAMLADVQNTLYVLCLFIIIICADSSRHERERYLEGEVKKLRAQLAKATGAPAQASRSVCANRYNSFMISGIVGAEASRPGGLLCREREHKRNRNFILNARICC